MLATALLMSPIFVLLRDIQIRTQSAAIRSKQARYLLSHPCPYLATPIPKIFLQYCGSGMFVPDPNFFAIPDPGSASKNVSILTGKMVSKHLEIWSRVFHPGSGDPDFLPIPDPEFRGSKRNPDPRSGSGNTSFLPVLELEGLEVELLQVGDGA